MAHKSKVRKILKITAAVFAAIILTAATLVGLDFKNYKDSNRSVLFGSLNNYTQNQTLKFDNLELKVSSVSLRAYPAPAQPAQMDCSNISKDPYSSSYRLSNFWRFGNSPYSECQYFLTNYSKAVDHYKAKDELAVTFQYSNISDQPLNLGDFKVKTIANTPLDIYTSPLTTCTGMQTSLLLKGSTITECLAMDIDKNYSGPLVLSVVKNGKEKDIKLELPTIVFLK